MKIIIGLGNPGTKYEHTRHNAGFLAIDYYLKDIDAISCQSKFKAQVCEVHFGATKTFFVKPQTYMNRSGEAVQEIATFYKIDPKTDILVLHDEIDLPFGTIRNTDSSSAAGHNGVQSIIDALGTQDFHRIRIGVESRASRDELPTDVFVLSPFTAEQMQQFESDILPKVKIEINKFLQI